MAGVALGLLANAISPRGISLRHDYFANVTPVRLESAAPAAAPLPGDGINAALQARLTGTGVGLVSHAQAAEFFRDPGLAEGRIVFIDARDDAHYAAGHIPGALPFDHYRMEKYVAEAVGAGAVAERIVVYCNGGECEDSALVAGDLLALGVTAGKVYVYAGGIAEWRSHGMPVETGARGSGRLLKP